MSIAIIEKPSRPVLFETLEPRTRAQAADPLEPREHQRVERVLLIEDDRDLSHGLALRLQRGGLKVDRAFDGPTGLDRFRILQPDVVILDLCLPRMDGAKFLHFARMSPGARPVPVIAITGSADPALIRKVANWGVHRILRKPVSPKEVLQVTLEAIEGL